MPIRDRYYYEYKYNQYMEEQNRKYEEMKDKN